MTRLNKKFPNVRGVRDGKNRIGIGRIGQDRIELARDGSAWVTDCPASLFAMGYASLLNFLRHGDGYLTLAALSLYLLTKPAARLTRARGVCRYIYL